MTGAVGLKMPWHHGIITPCSGGKFPLLLAFTISSWRHGVQTEIESLQDLDDTGRHPAGDTEFSPSRLLSTTPVEFDGRLGPQAEDAKVIK